ncbi:MAG: hypothetical protein ACK47B_02890 [Armatimonadota bacterium]
MGAKRARRAGLWVGGSLFGLLLAVLAGSAAYWRYVTAVPEVTLPVDAAPPPRGFLDGMGAAFEVQRSLGPTPATWPEGTTAELERTLSPVRPALQRLRASYGREWRVPLSRLTQYQEEHSAFREAARCFAAEALLAERRGDADAALGNLLDAIELGVRLREGEGTLGMLVGAAVAGIGLARVEALPARVSLAALETALARLDRLQAGWPSVAQAMETEAAIAPADMARYFRELNGKALPRQWTALDDFGDFGRLEKFRLLLSPRREALARVEGYYRVVAKEAGKPIPAQVTVPLPADPWAEYFCVEHRAPFVQLDHTRVRLLYAALAVERRQREQGYYPGSWEELRGKWLRGVPQDEWGRPLVYRLQHGRPLVYSLGPDGIDDGGRSVEVPWSPEASARGDIVFGQLRPRHRAGFTAPPPAEP